MWANFKVFWKEQLTHFGLGAFAVFAAMYGLGDGQTHHAFGFAIPGLQYARQLFEWLNRKDTIGIDLTWVLGGCATGYFAAVALHHFG